MCRVKEDPYDKIVDMIQQEAVNISAFRQYPRLMDAQFTVPTTNSSQAHNGISDVLYSSWSAWNSCSVTCGVGISSRKRSCLKNVYNAKGVSVPICHGELAEHKICKLQACPPNSQSGFEKQCSQYNDRIIAGKLVKEWIPSREAGPNPCELRCEAKSEKLVYGFGKVSSGTPCPLGVCLDGRCLQVGCDERLGSDVKLDMCGVCGGRNATCVHYKDFYLKQPSHEGGKRNAYSEVVVIPVGARNIIVRQTVGKNFLALQDKNNGIIFNRDLPTTKYEGHYRIAGASVEFKKLDNTSEVLLVKGPVAEDMYVLVLLRSENRGIHYEYWLPKQTYNHFGSEYAVPLSNKEPSRPVSTTTIKPVPSIAKPNVVTHTHHHPTKPAFAYGYGEKPYQRRDAPIFRHIPTTATTTEAIMDDKDNFVPSVVHSKLGRAHEYSPNREFLLRKEVLPMYQPKYLSRQPVADYYQTYRNASIPKPIKRSNLDDELPVLTQQDSSSPDEKGSSDNLIPNDFFADRKYDSTKFRKPSRYASDIDKKLDKALRNYVPNGRLKYSVDSNDKDEVYVNASGRFTPTPLSIAVLPLPDGKVHKTQKSRPRDGDKQQLKPRLTRGGSCEPCPRNRNQTKHFCESDFVIRAEIIGYEFLQGETRYELEVKQSYKNTLSLLPKEFIWSPDACRCPKLRQGKEYVIMGRIDNGYRKRESRLLVDKSSFVRTYNLKYARRLQKLRKDRLKKCKSAS
ncbi:ADAMTS-like protein 5 [Uloborus diversus]|uniref:ADAMTS-like protein 5 n=1 Tax=Uloborus diversus TaxID=327109 RepID=UPI00240A1C6E|nr:ADAMTS-like protein 5 [Uloborus diversus]